MKKSILAVLVPTLLASGAANAAINLYDENGVTVDVSGAAEIQFIQDFQANNKPQLRVDDGDLAFFTTAEITPGLSAIAKMAFRFELGTSPNNTPDGGLSAISETATTTNDELYVGLTSSYGTFTMGRQALISDDAGNGKDYELGTMSIAFPVTVAAQTLKYVYDNGTYYGGTSYVLDEDPANAALINVDGQSAGSDRRVVDGRLGFRYGGLDTRVYGYYGVGLGGTGFFPGSKAGSDVTGQANATAKGFNYELNYQYGRYDFAAAYGIVKYTPAFQSGFAASGLNVTRTGVDVTTWQISAGFQADEKTYFAIGYNQEDIDVSQRVATTDFRDKSYDLYANTTYMIHNNVVMYAEVGVADVRNDNKKVDTDIAYLAGLEVSF